MNDKNVYVIDDDDAMRDSWIFCLELRDSKLLYSIQRRAFWKGFQGWSLVASYQTCAWPESTGSELLKRIQGGDKVFPVIMMTGHGDIRLAVEAMKLGATDFLEKPFDDDRLISTIEEALQRKMSHRQALQ